MTGIESGKRDQIEGWIPIMRFSTLFNDNHLHTEEMIIIQLGIPNDILKFEEE